MAKSKAGGRGPVIDPTKNVLDLVMAESKYQDAMRNAGEKLSKELSSAETRRVDDLAALRLQYDTQISENLRVQVKTTSELISTQLDKVTTSLSTQITSMTASFSAQIQLMSATLGQRIADLERFRWEVGGKTSVSDPATERVMSTLISAVTALEKSQESGAGRGVGQTQILSWIMQVVTFVGVVVAIAVAVHAMK